MLRRRKLGKSGRPSLFTIHYELETQLVLAHSQSPLVQSMWISDDNDCWHGIPWSSLEKVFIHKLLKGNNHGFGSHHKIDP